MSAFTGALADLNQLADNLAELGSIPSRASRFAASGIADLILEEFEYESDPYGHAWEEHSLATVARWGEHPILDLTSRMRDTVDVRAMPGAGISVTFDAEYAGFHQEGTVNMPARPVLPGEAMPPAWEEVIEDACAKASARALRRS